MTKKKPPEMLTPRISVDVRGTVYPTVKDACKALNVKPGSIYGLLSRGRINSAGLGTKRPFNGHYQIPPKKIKIGGKEFESLAALSKFLGKSKQYASNTIRRYDDGMKRLEGELLRVCLQKTAKEEVMVRKMVEDQMYEEDRKRRY